MKSTLFLSNTSDEVGFGLRFSSVWVRFNGKILFVRKENAFLAFSLVLWLHNNMSVKKNSKNDGGSFGNKKCLCKWCPYLSKILNCHSIFFLVFITFYSDTRQSGATNIMIDLIFHMFNVYSKIFMILININKNIFESHQKKVKRTFPSNSFGFFFFFFANIINSRLRAFESMVVHFKRQYFPEKFENFNW